MWYLVVFFFKPKPADEIRISDWSSDVCSSDLTHTKVVAVTVLTSLDAPDLDDIGVGGTPHDQVVRLAALARQAGLDGIVCSGQEVKTARRAWPGGYFVVPGVRPANGKASDQKRIVTPAQAMSDGASILFVGRPISQSPDPDLAARERSEQRRVGQGCVRTCSSRRSPSN